MRLRAAVLALAAALAFTAPAAAAGKKPERRLGAAYAKKRAPVPPLVKATSRVQSSGTACRSRARG